MAQSEVPKGRSGARRIHRVRSGLNLPQRHNLVGFHGHGLLALILFAILALAVLGVGLALASLTIFAVGQGPHHGKGALIIRTSPTPSANALVGQPVDGTLVAVSVGENLIAIQPDGGSAVQATIDAHSQITRGGAAAGIGDLIPGDAVIVTFSAGPHGGLVVATLQDIETVPTNTPSPTPAPPTPPPTPNPEPSPGPSGPPGPGGGGGGPPGPP
ncbi:MAG: hypothetical protein ACREOD_06025 [Candidatus Dormibacteria bacterium]